MEYITRCTDRQAITEIDNQADNFAVAKEPSQNLFECMLRRWRVILFTAVIAGAVGVPVVWMSVQPYYEANAAVRISPVLSSVLFGGQEGMPMYKTFMYTQADLITSDRVLKAVADDLSENRIDFSPDPASFLETVMNKWKPAQKKGSASSLRSALIGEKLTVFADESTELIKIRMRSSDPEKAASIANAFVKAYITIVASEELKDGDTNLETLRDQLKTLEDEIREYNATIFQMGQEYGTLALTDRQQMMLNRVVKLQEKLTEFEMERIALQARISLRQEKKPDDITPKESLKLRYDFVNADLIGRALAENVAQLERDLAADKQIMLPDNPKLLRKEAILKTVNQRLEERYDEMGKRFDEMMVKEASRTDLYLNEGDLEKLKQLAEYEKHIRDMLASEDADAIELGRKQLAMQNVQNRLEMTKELYNSVQRRIRELEMQSQQPGRISVAYYANTAPFEDSRIKYTSATAVFALMLGMFLAFVKDRVDTRVQPEGTAKQINARILGTTSSKGRVKQAKWVKQVDDDYQTICVNLGLINGQGMPKSVLITSPGPKEGKSTLAVKLATNLAKLGKMVLLVEGDLRKPSLSNIIHPNDNGRGLENLLAGETLEQTVCSTKVPGLLFLKAECRESSVIYRLLERCRTEELIEKAADIFDHVIIDSPPLLAAIDAIIWAKMVEGVILTGFAGQTKSIDLKEVISRLKQVNVKIFGVVINNVPTRHSYHPYGYEKYSASNGDDTVQSRCDFSHILPMNSD